jgi:hypothetical protein
MPGDLVAFVCEGPTCSDRWDSARPRLAIVERLRIERQESVCVARKICLGDCQQGPNLQIGARIHHPATVAEAAALIRAEATADSGSRTDAGAATVKAEVTVAANPELA